MADLTDQYRILYVLYERSCHKDKRTSILDLQTTNELQYMHMVRKLNPELTYLIKTGYVEGSYDDLQLTGKGLETTISIFRKFLTFIKKDEEYSATLSTWIDHLECRQGDSWEFIRDAFFYIKGRGRLPLMENAFNDYLRHVKSIENILSFEIEEYYIGSLIDDIFRNIDDVNRLFKHKFSRRLFCPPVPSQSYLRQAASGKQVRLTDFVATLGLVIDGICHSEVNSLVDPTRLAECKDSIDKIQALLEGRNINYNANYIAKLRTLRKLRNTFPIHETGSKSIGLLQDLNIGFPIENEKDAALKMLQAFNSCILEMKVWFGT